MLLCMGIVSGTLAEVEYGHFVRPTTSDEWSPSSVSLNAGERIVILNGDGLSDIASSDIYQHTFSVDYDGNILNRTIVFRFYRSSSSGTSVGWSSDSDRTIVGACVISPNTGANDGTVIDYKIVRHEVTAPPMNIISLPDDNNGDVDLLLETSTDLISWTPIYSGSAGTSNSAAFFRTRLIQK